MRVFLRFKENPMSKPEQPAEQDVFAMRHSLAHIMATAIQELYPEAKFLLRH
jgi:threonyl-tRNA synthetase